MRRRSREVLEEHRGVPVRSRRVENRRRTRAKHIQRSFSVVRESRSRLHVGRAVLLEVSKPRELPIAGMAPVRLRLNVSQLMPFQIACAVERPATMVAWERGRQHDGVDFGGCSDGRHSVIFR